MKFIIKHEIRGRIRVQACVRRMSIEEADTLQYYLDTQEWCNFREDTEKHSEHRDLLYGRAGSRCSHSFGLPL